MNGPNDYVLLMYVWNITLDSDKRTHFILSQPQGMSYNMGCEICHVYVCMLCVCMYAMCMYVGMYAYAWMHVCMYVRRYQHDSYVLQSFQ